MQPYIYIPIILLWIIIFTTFRNQRRAVILRKIIERKRKTENTEMKELAERFIGKECLLYTFDGGRQYEGTVKEVTDGALLIEKDGAEEAVNLDFIIRIREYPKNKKGKKKSLVLD